MARAKRTDRAEARRRYRAQLAAEGREELEPTEDAEPAATVRGPIRTTPRAAAATPPAPQRPGIGNAFRAAFRRANFREDLAVLPQLVRHRSIWLPALITIGTTAVFLTTGGADVVSALLFQYFIYTPGIGAPMGAVFLAGFLAPRASYLAGAITGLVGTFCLAIALAVTDGALGTTPLPSASPSPSALPSLATGGLASALPSGSVVPSPSAQPTPVASPPSSAPPGDGGVPRGGDAVAFAPLFLLSALSGAFFASAAAWYRRFLNLANPNRGARRQQQTKGKPRRR